MREQTRTYVASFRIRELKEVLTALQLSSSATRKAELQSRIYQYLGVPDPNGLVRTIQPQKDPETLRSAEKIIEDIWCKWKEIPAEDRARHLASTLQSPQMQRFAASSLPLQQTPEAPSSRPSQVEIIPAGGGSSSGMDRRSDGKGTPVNGKLVNSAARPGRGASIIRCVCDNNLDRGFQMVQCEGAGCGVFQHANCLGIDALPERHFCELCRAAWADPFWEVKNARIFPPSKLIPTGAPPVRGAGGASEASQLMDKAFALSHSQIDLIKKSSAYQLQAVSLLLNDPVSFRFQWPKNAELRINSMLYRVYSRPPGSKVGTNLRDEPANLAHTAFVGRNRLRLQVNDSRKFVLLSQLVKRRSIDEVKELMAPPETLEAALQRVRQQVGGSDDDLAIGATVLSLKDPLSGLRVSRPARFIGTGALVAFDLDTFLTMAQRSRKWQCPHSMRHTRVQELQIDTFLSTILERLQDHPEIMEIEVSPEGTWRPTGGAYPWTQVSDPLPNPLPEVGAAADLAFGSAPPVIDTLMRMPFQQKLLQKLVKPEFEGGATGLAASGADSDEEELSEGEELRRAANAYATSARQAAQEVIVLDDSDEEPPLPKRPAPPIVFEPQSQRQRTLQQPTLHSSLDAFRRGAGGGPGSGSSAFQTSQPNPTSSSSGLTLPASSGRYVHGSSTVPSSGPPGVESRLNIRLPSRAPQNLSRAAEDLPRLHSSSQGLQLPVSSMQQVNQEGAVSSSQPLRNAANGYFTYEVAAPSFQPQAQPYLGSPPHHGAASAWLPNARTSQALQRPGAGGWGSPLQHSSPQGFALQSPPQQLGGAGDSMTQALHGVPHSPLGFQQPRPPLSDPPLPPKNDRVASDSWNTNQNWTPTERRILGSLLQDDAISPGSQGNVQVAKGLSSYPAPPPYSHVSSSVIDLDSD